MTCPVCLEPFRDACMLPACGHSFCASCIDQLPLQRTLHGREAKCPICRANYTAGTRVPNWTLREAATSNGNARVSVPSSTPAARPSLSKNQQSAARQPADPRALAALHVPPALIRLACDEAKRVAVRVFLLDNSGSTAAHDGHLLQPYASGSYTLRNCTRWQEICQSAETACALGAATGVPCEFHLLNPLGGWTNGGNTGLGHEGLDWIRTTGAPADKERLSAFLSKSQPGGVTPVAERVRALAPRFAVSDDERREGAVAFFIVITDGAPTSLHSGQPTSQAAQSALRELRQLTRVAPVRIVVRLCTDDDDAVSFWNGADAEDELPLDVLDDLMAEAKEVYECGNGWLAYTPALHMLRESGTMVGLLDLLDERRLRPGEAATLAALLLDGDSSGSAAPGVPSPAAALPDWQYAPEEFKTALRMRCTAVGDGWDARRRKLAPIVNSSELLRSMQVAGWGGGPFMAMAKNSLCVMGFVLLLVAIWFQNAAGGDARAL